MTYKMRSSCLNFFVLFLSLVFICSCTKDNELPVNLSGEYCTYREGPTGHTTSTIDILQDTSGRHDLIISNISGYTNTSEAFKNIACDRLNNRLVIPEVTVLIGNSNVMLITGEGEVDAEGSIRMDIETITDNNQNNFSLYLTNNSSYNYYQSYKGDGQSLTVQSNQINLQVTTEDDQTLDFIIEESENANCSLSISRHSVLDQFTNEGYLLEAEIYFSGARVFGTLYYSSGSWQNAQSIELNLQ